MDKRHPNNGDAGYDYTHPEKRYKNLIFCQDGLTPFELQEEREPLTEMLWSHEQVELCWACGWNERHECLSSYGPRIKIVHTWRNKGLWAIGSDWFLRDQPNDCTLGNDYMTQQFLRDQQPPLNIPLVKEMRRISKPDDQILFTLISRAHGETLEKVWNTLTPDQKSSYSHQMADVLRQLRRFTAPTAQRVDGSLIDDSIIGVCGTQLPTCHKVGRTTDEWFNNLEAELRRGLSVQHKTTDEKIIEEKLQALKDGFPSGGPYVLTHGDLNLSNIIVNNGKIEAIIDWEVAGYLPWWAERYTSLRHTRECDELFEPVWNELCPEIDSETFGDQIFHPLYNIELAYFWCPRDHIDRSTRWKRPGFCACKPYAGSFDWISMGNSTGHRILGPGEKARRDVACKEMDEERERRAKLHDLSKQLTDTSLDTCL